MKNGTLNEIKVFSDTEQSLLSINLLIIRYELQNILSDLANDMIKSRFRSTFVIKSEINISIFRRSLQRNSDISERIRTKSIDQTNERCDQNLHN